MLESTYQIVSLNNWNIPPTYQPFSCCSFHSQSLVIRPQLPVSQQRLGSPRWALGEEVKDASESRGWMEMYFSGSDIIQRHFLSTAVALCRGRYEL